MTVAPVRAGSVVAVDGREIRGQVSRRGDLWRVETPLADVLLTAAAVRSVEAGGGVETFPVYSFHPETRTHPKRGRIEPVHRDLKVEPFAPNGLRAASLTDPHLGPIRFTFALTELTPWVYRMEAVEYAYALSFPLRTLGGAELAWIREVTPDHDAKAQWKAAQFYRMAGRLAQARLFIVRAREIAPEHPAVLDELRQLERAETMVALGQASRLLDSGALDAAGRGLDALPDPLPPDLAFRRKELLDRIDHLRAVHARLADQFPGAFPGAVRPTAAQLLHLDRVLGPESPVTRGLEAVHVKALLEPWADPLPSVQAWTAVHLESARKLADQVAEYFAAGNEADPRPVAKALAESPLPLSLRLAVFRHAVGYPAAKTTGWTRIDFSRRGWSRPFHYYVQAPPAYRPEIARPVLIALHGQNSRAIAMHGFWGDLAARRGWILISPEYVYDREMGYRRSAEEHEAVLGALEDAAQSLNIDMDRVFLTGHSQGGHAAWDIGAAHAGRFAGVLPFIGAPLFPTHTANLADSALYAVDGSDDGRAPLLTREAMPEMARAGADATYVEYRGRDHEGFFEEFEAAADWMDARQRRRDGIVRLACLSPAEARRDWVEIREPRQGWPRSRLHVKEALEVEGRIEGDTVLLKTRGVQTARIFFCPDLLPVDREVRVVVNGRIVYRGTPGVDWEFALEDSRRRRDRLAVYVQSVDVRCP